MASKHSCCFIFMLSILKVYCESYTKYVYLTNVTGILRFGINATTTRDALGETEVLYLNEDVFIRSLTIDEKNRHLYWSDLRHNDIVQCDLEGKASKKIFSYAIGFAEGLTIDWSSDNIYWSDSLMKVIEVATTAGLHRKVLFSLGNGDEPRAIMADPQDGYLFWSDWGKFPKIERSSLAGTNRVTIISKNIRWPNDLAIDYLLERIYWIDAYYDHIASSKFDGNDWRVETVLKQGVEVLHPYSFAYYPQYNITYFTDWYNDSLFSLSPLVPNKTFQNVYKNSPRLKTIGQVRILGVDKPSNVNTPCADPSNVCSHLCLKSGRNTSVCECPTGMVKFNWTSCSMRPKEFEIFFIDDFVDAINHLVKYKNQSGFTVRPLSIPSNEMMKSMNALDFDSNTQDLYWTDLERKKLYRMKSNSSGFEVVLTDVYTDAVRVNKLSSVIYYHDKNAKAIVRATLDGRHKEIIKTNVAVVNDMAIHEEMGYIFYPESFTQVVARIDQDGENLVEYRETRRSMRVTGITIDRVENRVYWCDQNNYKVVSTDLNLNDVKIIIQQTFFIGLRFWIVRNRGFVVQPNSIDIQGEKIYWTDTYKRAIFESEKRFGGDITYITGGVDRARDIHVYSDEPKVDYVKVYQFAVARSYIRRQYAWCVRQASACSFSRVGSVPACPPGYKQTKVAQKCLNCSETLGGNFVCPCNDWASCAQRTYSKVFGCHTTIPYMTFKVRECTKEVRPGYCPYSSSCPSNSKTCLADHDCDGKKKCCKTSCGSRCIESSQKSDHPCEVGTSGCSHFCLAKKDSFKCACPTNSVVDFIGKTCVADRCHGKKCYNGKCFSLVDGNTVCKCSQSYWVGRFCSLNLNENLVIARFKRKKNVRVSIDEIKRRLAFDFSDYCLSSQCAYIEEAKRRRRMTPIPEFSFTADDIFVSKYNDKDGTQIKVTFTITKPKDQFNLTGGHLSVDTVLTGLNKFGSSFAQVLNMEYLSSEKAGQEKKDSKKLSDAAVAAIILVVVVLIISAAVAFYWYQIKRTSQTHQPSQMTNQENERPVHYQFENELYDDVNKGGVKLPDMQHADNNDNKYVDGAEAVHITDDEKKNIAQDWVTFDNANTDEKPPITDFVEAELYSDPYHIESPPPAYTSPRENEYET